MTLREFVKVQVLKVFSIGFYSMIVQYDLCCLGANSQLKLPQCQLYLQEDFCFLTLKCYWRYKISFGWLHLRL